MREPADDRDRLARRWALVAAHRDRLLRLTSTRTASAADAEDAVQETLLRAVQFDDLDEDRVGPFLTSVALRVCADSYRASGRVDRLHVRLGNGLVDEEPPDEQVCDDAEARAVASVVATLPDRQRRVVTARSQGLSCQQVATRLGLSYSAVESALSRARAAVRTRVEVCLDATALAGLRVARALRAVPGEVPSASAVAFGGALTSALALHATLPAAALPEPPAVVRTVPAAHDHAAGTSAATPVPARSRGAVVTHVVPAPVVAPRPRPRPTSHKIAGVGPAQVSEQDTGYTTQERLMHCVKYGIELQPTVQCKTPPPDAPDQTTRSPL
jgi:RNA polymerase sigma-70 factor (ECF subfamily)